MLYGTVQLHSSVDVQLCSQHVFKSVLPCPSMLFKIIDYTWGLSYYVVSCTTYHYSFPHCGFAVCFKLRKFWASNFFITYRIVLSVCRLLEILADFMEFPAIIFSLSLWERLFWPISSAALRACRLHKPQITFQHCEWVLPKGRLLHAAQAGLRLTV